MDQLIIEQRNLNQMMNFSNTFINTVCHIIIDGRAQQKFYIVSHVIMMLQTISCIAHPNSSLYLIVKWSDPSTFLPPSLSIYVCLTMVILFSVLVIIKLAITENTEIIQQPNTLKIYMGNILLHLQMLNKTCVLAPLMRATIMQLINPSSNSTRIAGITAFVLYTLFLLPLSLYNTSNTFILTPQINKKLTYINIYLILNIFRVPFAILSVDYQHSLLSVSALFFGIFLFMSFKQPVFTYNHEVFLKGIISAIAFTCLLRICDAFVNPFQQSIMIQLIGMASFIGLIDLISKIRVKTILQLPKPTIHQLKILIYLTENIKDYRDKLHYFIINHHSKCEVVDCLCHEVIQNIFQKQKGGSQIDAAIWYKFLINFIQQHFNLDRMETLPQSEMKFIVQKYQYIVIDLAEMYLFKLAQVNKAYYIVNNYRQLLEDKGFSFLSFLQKKKIIYYYLQENISNKYHTEGVINLNADTYMNFQIIFERYRRMLIRSAKSAAVLWQQMNRYQPDGQKLYRAIQNLQEWHQKIKQSYHQIINHFQNSAEILSHITNDFYEKVLNISEKSPFHIIDTSKYESIMARKKAQNVQKISENMQAFSFKSQTPMCFVAVDKDKLGEIVGTNSHFNKIMNLEYGHFIKIQEFIVPEMRKNHEEKMKKFINGDLFHLQHKHGFTLNLKGKLVYTKILVQIIPSISEGLRYVFFLKKIMEKKRIFGLKNYTKIVYTSKSFDDRFIDKSSLKMISKSMSEQNVNILRETKELKINLDDSQITLKMIIDFNDEKDSWLYLQFCEQTDVMIQTRFQISSSIEANKKAASMYRKNMRKDSILSRDDDLNNQKTNMQKSDLQERLAAQKQKKNEQTLRNTYQVLINDKKRSIIKRNVCFTVIVNLLLVGLLLAALLLKLSTQQRYNSTADINNAYTKFILTINSAISNLKYVNFHMYTGDNKTALLYLSAANKSINVNQKMDDLVINFQIQSITQIWPTLNCITDTGVFKLNNQSNLLTVSDFIQNPVTNLVASPIANLKFIPYFKALSLPLTSSQCQYYELMYNGLYITIPLFQKLKKSKMNSLALDKVSLNVPLIIVFASSFLLNIIYVMGKFIYNSRITRAKNSAYNLFTKLSRQSIQQKQKLSREFVTKYTIFKGSQNNRDYSPFESESVSESENEVTLGKSIKNVEKTIDDQTERELGDTFTKGSAPDLGRTPRRTQITQKKQSKQKSWIIFEETSLKWIAIKYFLLAFPFAIFPIIFSGIQVSQTTVIKNAFLIQQKIQTVKLNINLIKSYGMQLGVQNLEISQYYDIQNYLNLLLQEIYNVQRDLVSNKIQIGQLLRADQYIKQIAFGNLCNFSLKFKTILPTNCSEIGSGVLQKGFYSSIISYVQSLNTLLLLNSNMNNYSTSQRISQYLNSSFFMQDGELSNYFTTILDIFSEKFDNDFSDLVSNSANLMIYSIIGLISLMIIMGILAQRQFINKMRKQIQSTKSIFLLISYETIVKEQAIRQGFFQRVESFKRLK